MASVASQPAPIDSNPAIATCSLTLIVALYVVGFVSHGVLRHIVQTAPLWPGVVMGFRRSPWTKWCVLPSYAIWIFLMTLIWLFLLGWSKIISGTFSPIEIAMTLIVGLSSIAGGTLSLRERSGILIWKGLAASAVFLAFQVLAIWISFKPGIAHD